MNNKKYNKVKKLTLKNQLEMLEQEKINNEEYLDPKHFPVMKMLNQKKKQTKIDDFFIDAKKKK